MDKSDREVRCVSRKPWPDGPAWLGLFRLYFGLALAGSRPQAGPCTSLVVDPVVLFSLADPVAVPVVYTHNMAIIEITLDRHLSIPPRREAT